jgi:SecD/SecF fusion protein
MLRRLIVIGLVFATCLLLLFLQNKVLVGEQELSAELRLVPGQAEGAVPATFQVVLKDVAGNPVAATADDREALVQRLKGSPSEILVGAVTLEDADKRVLVTTNDKTDVAALRTRVAAKPFKRDNTPRDLFHITRGIDLRGGVEFICRLHNEEGRVVPADDEVLEILRNRLDERGLTEPAVARLSNGDIQVVIPGGTKADASRTRRVLETTGRLEFREVLAVFDQVNLGGADAPVLAKPNGSGYTFASGTYHNRGDIIVPHEPEPGEKPTTFYRLEKPSLVGKDVKDASQTYYEGTLAIGIEFTAVGAGKNEEFTRAVKTRGDAKQGTGMLAIVFDGMVKSSARVIEPSGASCVIHGNFTHDEIENIRSALRGGSLAVTPEVLSERVVGATLGEETIRKGLLAMAVSFFAIVAFMQFYYGRRLGTVANLCLVATGFVIWSILSVFGATVTLPGLAGLVLTIGMAVDTNILIFERIREELRENKGMKASIEAGYDRAFLTIVDAHLTTLITAFILYWIGSGPVKGFGLTLIIGIVVNLFSGVYIGRMLTDWMCAKVETVKMASWVPELKLPYVEWRRAGYAFSIVTAVMGIGWFAFGHKLSGGSFERNFDIDFTGGNMVQVIFKEELTAERIDQAIATAHAKDPQALALIDPQELRKQPYFAEFGGSSPASRQWVFRSRDEQGGELEAARAVVEKQRAKLQHQIDDLRAGVGQAAEKPDEAGARKLESEQLAPLQKQVAELGNQVANRTEDFKRQLAQALVGSVGAEGSEILAAQWQERSLTLRLATLEPVGATTASEMVTRLKKRTELENVTVTPVEGEKAFAVTVTFKALPSARSEFERSDATVARLYELLAADGLGDGDRNARTGIAAELYNDLINVAAAQKVTVARPYPSSEHFSGQVADQMKWGALLALLLSLLAILAYVASRFEFRFGVGAVLSLFHDAIITVGIISALGVRIDLTVIAALLTMIGYSINDTIVTFDRIREMMRKNGTDGAPPLPLPEIINRGIAQTMPRTVLTTGTVFLTVLVLVLFGGEALHAFALTLLIGILSGTYSSIFVAAPLLLSFKGRISDAHQPVDPNAADPNAVGANAGEAALLEGKQVAP